MLRITGGEFRGRKIPAPSGSRVRPTGSRTREAIFNILRPLLPNARVLDLFAGSGILGFEALSRGAGAVTFVDFLPGSVREISGSAARLGVSGRVRVLRASWPAALSLLEGEIYDLVLADPPYRFFAPGAREGEKLLASLWGCAIVSAEAWLAVEHPAEAALPAPTGGWLPADRRSYGREGVAFFCRRGVSHEKNGDLRRDL